MENELTLRHGGCQQSLLAEFRLTVAEILLLNLYGGVVDTKTFTRDGTQTLEDPVVLMLTENRSFLDTRR